jgi:hypothetical protein
VYLSSEVRPTKRNEKGVTLLLGPVIVAGGRTQIDHPEHSALDLPPGIYQTAYQMDWDRQQAVRD